MQIPRKMEEYRTRRRAETNAFFIFLIKTKLVYQLTGRLSFALQKEEFHKLADNLTEKGFENPSYKLVLKIFAQTHGSRSCVLSKKTLNPLCGLLDAKDYEHFAGQHLTDYSFFLKNYKDKFGQEFDTALPFYLTGYTERNFILDVLNKIALRDAENKITAENFSLLFGWLKKKSGEKLIEQNDKLIKQLLNKQLNTFANLKNRSVFSLLQHLADNINSGYELFYNTGLSETCTYDLIQAIKNEVGPTVSRLSFYESYLRNNIFTENANLLYSYWLWAFTTEQISNKFGVPANEIDNIISENIDTMNKQYNKKQTDA